MKKKCIFLFFILVSFFIIQGMNYQCDAATTVTSGNYQYEEQTDGTIKLIRYTDRTATQVAIPTAVDGKTVTALGSYLFYPTETQKPAVVKATVPKTVTTIDPLAFVGCPALEQIIVDSANTKFTAVNGILFSKDKTQLLHYPEGKSGTSYTIPTTTKIIGEDSFMDNQFLQTITIPSSVTQIQDWAFARAKLTSINIPTSVTKIGNGICSEMPELKTAVFSAKVSDLEYLSFTECSKLESINMSKSTVTGIDARAFFASDSLKSVVFPPNIKTISVYAFMGCNNLTSVVIPSTVTKIDADAFAAGCKLDISKTSLTKLSNGSYAEVVNISVDATLDYEEAYKVLDLVNAERAKVGASALKMDKKLLEAAMQRAAEISVYFEHTRPNGLRDSSLLSGVSYTMEGENIAGSYANAESVMNGWMNSSGHKANILRAEFNNIGIGCVIVNGRRSWVQTFTKSTTNTAVTKPSNVDKKVSIQIATDNLNLYFYNTQESVEIGKTHTSKIYQKYIDGSWTQITPINVSDFSWKSSNTSVATIDANGIVKGIKAGTATITATTKEGNVSASYTITVIKPITAITMTQTSITMDYKETKKLAITFTPSDTNMDKTIKWKVSDTWVATIDANGVLTPKRSGKITVTATSSNGKTATCTIDIKAPIETITMAKTLELDTTEDYYLYSKLDPEISPFFTTDSRVITWKSSNKEVVDISNSQPVLVGPGTATLTATTANGKTATCKITAKASISYINIASYYGGEIGIGCIYEPKFKVYPENTTDSKTLTYKSSNPKVATVDSNGRITTLAEGTATITATSVNGKTADYNITVKDKPIEYIYLNNYDGAVDKGKSIQLYLTSYPSYASGTKDVTYTSSDPKIATVDKNGKVTGISKGIVTITATLKNGMKASRKVVVNGGIPEVSYRTHVQNVGWQNYVKNGDMSGTSGKSLRLEGINIKVDAGDYTGGITYRTHVQNIGWQEWKSNDAMSGTSGKGLRLEAIQIKLTGEIANNYDVYYRVHVQNFGWLDWAKNGQSAGSAGYGYRLEGIQIKLVKKGEAAPGSTSKPFIQTYIVYQTHVQNIGWQGLQSDGNISGTSGKSYRLEGIKIYFNNPLYSGDVEYRTHVQNIGWQNYVKNGATAGTSGKGLKLEAIQIRLTGEMAQKYDIYYRVHCQNFGWMGWAKNGEAAGSEGYCYRLEGIQIKLVEKGKPAPGSTENTFKRR